MLGDFLFVVRLIHIIIPSLLLADNILYECMHEYM